MPDASEAQLTIEVGHGARADLDYAAIEAALRGMLADIDAKGRETAEQEFTAEDRFPDLIDLASSEESRSMTLRLRDREHRMLRKVREALRRLEEGSYGICEDCGEDIAPARLLARPVTTLCTECKEERERGEV